jgi:hypothetical protein
MLISQQSYRGTGRIEMICNHILQPTLSCSHDHLIAKKSLISIVRGVFLWASKEVRAEKFLIVVFSSRKR